MTVTFIYNGKQYTTNNLEKKLNKLGISKNDIKLLGSQYRVVEIEKTNKIKVIIRSNIDNIRRVCYIDKDKSRPTIRELFKSHMWNSITKTGIKEFTEEYLQTLYYEN